MVKICPLTKDCCTTDCGMWDAVNEQCAILTATKAFVQTAKATDRASGSLNNIAINTEYLGEGCKLGLRPFSYAHRSP